MPENKEFKVKYHGHKSAQTTRVASEIAMRAREIMADKITITAVSEEIEDAKRLIQCIHQKWYSDPFESMEKMLDFQDHMSELFNFAGITSTLAENNPGEKTTSDIRNELKNSTE